MKSIIKSLLEKKVDKEKDKREIEKEISVIKQTIDDFKAGRLDKIKELQEKDNIAKNILPFKIIIINQPVITQPWGWHYQVVPQYPLIVSNGWDSQTITTVGTLQQSSTIINTAGYCSSSGLTGNAYATFSAGTYSLGNGVNVNLN